MKGGLAARGTRTLLRQIREAMAASAPAQARLDLVVSIIARSMVAEVCSIYLRRASGEHELFATEGLNRQAVHATRMRAGEPVGRARAPELRLPAGDGRRPVPLLPRRAAPARRAHHWRAGRAEPRR